MATDEQIENSVARLVNELYGNEADIVKEVITSKLEGIIYLEVEDCLTDSESPIEKVMSIALQGRFKNRQFGDEHSFHEIFQQRKIKTNDETYRVDFLVELINPTDKEVIQIVIECDGFDYHDRTKEQATRDKKRDRDLMLNGYRVMRFTGSEIHKNVGSCVSEVIRVCNKLTRHWRTK